MADRLRRPVPSSRHAAARQQGIGGAGDCGIATGLGKNPLGNYQYAYTGLGALTGFTTATSPNYGHNLGSTATRFSTITYTISYRNIGQNPASSATITDALPAQLSYVSASGGLSRTYDSTTRKVT